MTPFLRLLWKEYHSLRVLWIGVTLGTLVLWALMLLSFRGDASRQNDLSLLVSVVWSLAIWLPAVYLLACTAAQFAGEQEERTASWLTHFAAPFQPLISAKLLWTAATAAAMQILLLFAAGRVWWHYIPTLGPSGLLQDEERFYLGSSSFATFLLLESLAWGVFWSLQSVTVLRALVLSALTVVFINIFASALWAPNTDTMARFWSDAIWSWGFLRTGLTLGMLVIDYYLARRWLTGHSTSWSIPWERWRLHREAVPRAVAEVSAMEPGAPWSRAWQRFRWLEWQSIRGFVYLAGAAGAVLTGIGLLFYLRFPGAQGASSFLTLFLAMLCPLVTGVLAWQGEQRREQFRFFTNLGISPYALWWNKFALWFGAYLASAALLVLATVALMAAHFAWLAKRSSHPYAQRWFQYWYQHYGEVWFFDYVWTVPLVFLAIFTTSLYFRRTIYAVVVGIGMYAAVVTLASFNHELGLPAWLGYAPVAAWLLWCSLRQVPRWALERTGWRTAAVIAAEWLVFPAVFAVTVLAYWVYSVPSPDVDQIFAESVQRRVSQRYREAYRNQESFVPVDVRETLQAADELLREHTEARRRVGASDRLLKPEEWKDFHPDVSKFRDSLLRPNLLSRQLESAEWPKKEQAWLYVEMLLQDADRALAAGRSEDSIRDIRAVVRLVGIVLSSEPPTSASRVSIKQTHADLHARLVAWAQHPQQNPENVAQAIADIVQFDMEWWSPSVRALNQEYRESVDELDKLQKETGWISAPVLEHRRRLLACMYSNRALYLTHFQNLPSPWLMIYRPDLMTIGTADQIRAWRYRQPPHPHSMPLGINNQFFVWSQDLPIRLRCTLGTMAVVAFRAEHGRLPVSFDEVSPEFGSSQWWRLSPQMTKLELQTDGKWPSIPLMGVPDVVPGQDPGVPFVYVWPFVGQWGDPYGFESTRDANAYIFAIPPPPAAELP